MESTSLRLSSSLLNHPVSSSRRLAYEASRRLAYEAGDRRTAEAIASPPDVETDDFQVMCVQDTARACIAAGVPWSPREANAVRHQYRTLSDEEKAQILALKDLGAAQWCPESSAKSPRREEGGWRRCGYRSRGCSSPVRGHSGGL